MGLFRRRRQDGGGSAAVAEFWDWWQAGGAAVMATAFDTGDVGDVEAQVGPRVAAIDPALAWEFGPPGGPMPPESCA